MNKYIITLAVDGEEVPFSISAKTPVQAEKKLYSIIQFAKPVRVELKEDFKHRMKPFENRITSNFQRVISSKQPTLN